MIGEVKRKRIEEDLTGILIDAGKGSMKDHRKMERRSKKRVWREDRRRSKCDPSIEMEG